MNSLPGLWPVAVAPLLLLLLMAAEWVARSSIRRGRYFVFPPGSRERYWLHRPSHPQLEPVVRRMINDQGERGRAVPRAGRVFRTLVVGGSAAECFTLDQDTQWPAVLEARLRAPESLLLLGADDAHVGNIGRSGVDSGSLDLVLSRVMPYYPRLNLIIIMVGASDALRWLEAGAPADQPAKLLSETELFSWHPGMLFGWAPRRSGVAAWLRRMRGLSWTDHRDAGSWMGRARRDRANASKVWDVDPPSAVVREAFLGQMRSVVRRAAAHADRVLVVGQPWFEKDRYSSEEEALFWNGAIGQAFRGTVTEFYSTRVICTLMRAIDDLAGRIAIEERVEYLRLQGLIKPSTENFIDHFHATPAGAMHIGQLIAKVVLRESHLIPTDH